jgi:hypothetical protein
MHGQQPRQFNEEKRMPTVEKRSSTLPTVSTLWRHLPTTAFPIGLVVSMVLLGGCAARPEGDAAAMTRGGAAAMQSAEEARRTSGGMVGGGALPPAEHPGSSQAVPAPPRFPRQPDWDNTFWDISSP